LEPSFLQERIWSAPFPQLISSHFGVGCGRTAFGHLQDTLVFQVPPPMFFFFFWPRQSRQQVFFLRLPPLPPPPLFQRIFTQCFISFSYFPGFVSPPDRFVRIPSSAPPAWVMCMAQFFSFFLMAPVVLSYNPSCLIIAASPPSVVDLLRLSLAHPVLPTVETSLLLAGHARPDYCSYRGDSVCVPFFRGATPASFISTSPYALA